MKQWTQRRDYIFMKCRLLFLLTVLCLMKPPNVFAQKIMQTGGQFHGIRDFREVMPGALYRGGANNGHAPLRQDELDALCEDDIGTAIYLYTTGFSGPSVTHCSKGSLDYVDKGWEGQGRATIHKQIYNTIKSKGKPVFIHCWYGIHATGAVAATALMQFCNVSPKQAVEYWKVGVPPKLQYPKVIQSILGFKPNPELQLTPEERDQYCPHF
jgi:hypothetical protein